MASIQKLLEIAKAENGYLEKRKNCPTANLYEKVGNYVGSDNWTKYWKDCANLGLANYQGSYWCIAGIFWCMIQAFGLETAQKLCLQKFMINCQATHDLFKKVNRVYKNPKVGDIVVFWNGSRFNHAELVVSVNGDVIKTCGFNTSAVTSCTVYNGGACRYGKVYSLTAMVSGGARFLRPDYGNQYEETWIQDEYGNWKYQLSDGSFVKSTWKSINGKYYLFNADGYMLSGWQYDNGQWYYLSDSNSGEMQTGWTLIDGKWYMLADSGEMKIGWLQQGEYWYYLQDKDGSMAIGLHEICRMKYYFQDNGIMLSNTWKKLANGDWMYFSSTGAAYQSKWIQSTNGSYCYLKSDGIMATNCYVKDMITNVYYPIDRNGYWTGDELAEIPSGSVVVI